MTSGLSPPFLARRAYTRIMGGLGEERMRIDLELDARGLSCPLPILRMKKALSGLAPGQLLRVVATDPGSVRDFEAFCRQPGLSLVESSQADGEYTFVLQKGG